MSSMAIGSGMSVHYKVVQTSCVGDRSRDVTQDERARVVVIGGGVTGCSVAYHLAKAGWTDVVLVEKAELTSGSTCHAAGLVTQFNPSPTMMRFRRYSVELYNELGVFEELGSLRIASSPESLKELERGASRARGIGLDVDVISAAEALERMPAASPEQLYGAIWIAADGCVDPHTATYALAAAARDLGASIRTHTRVTGIELGPMHEVRAVLTEHGRIETEHVVNAAGMWAPQVSAMVGAFTPSVPVDHQHIALAAVRGHELPHDMPCFRDTDNLVYGRSEAGGALFGGYEPNPVARWTDGVPWSHSASTLPADPERFAQLMAGAVRRFPFLDDAGVVALVCHPDAMTPDGNPLLGPVPGVLGYWVAAGLSLNGFGGAGGMGRTLAEWMTAGETELDTQGFRAWRFGAAHRNPAQVEAGGREVYRYYYRLRYPLDSDSWGRPSRLSPLHGRLQELGAVFGSKNGWERADYFEPGHPSRRAGEDQRAFGWSAPPYLDLLDAEHTAFREAVGIIDMTSFGKINVSGPGALALLERVCDSRIDRPLGAVVYTQFLNHLGGIVADVTVTRLGERHFRVVTGAGVVDSDLGWLRLHARPEDGEVRLRDASAELAVIGIWGPRARDVLASVCADDVSAAVFAFRTARTVTICGAPVLAQRITYVGELGFELYVEPEWAVQVWDALVAAGAPHRIRPGGYRTLDSLRMEKGYRYMGTDLTAGDTPYEAGLGFCVALDKGWFIGRDALAAVADRPPQRRIRTLAIGGTDPQTVYGGEAVHAGGQVVSRVRSCAYGFTVRRNLAYAYLPAALGEGSRVSVEVFGELIGADVVADVLHDPHHTRVRA
jgi:glycine cleavage system aminomethyltransferase T/glycine/D-amino acid oxidase-like deaminating enzyme